MAKQYYFGSVPSDEPCTQVGSPDYEKRGRLEASLYVDQLYRFLAEEGHPKESLPKSFRIHVSTEAHDLGSYYDVVCSFDNDSPDVGKCHELALLIDWSAPSEWDAQSKEKLQAT